MPSSVTRAFLSVAALLISSLGLACQDPTAWSQPPQAAATQANAVSFGYTPIDLGSLGGESTVPLALNDSGHVVGHGTTAEGLRRGFLWRDGVMTELSTLIGGLTEAHAINNAGDIAGISEVEDFFPIGVVVWSAGVIRQLDQAGGTYYRPTQVVGINDEGHVLAAVSIGDTFDTDHTVLWRGGIPTEIILPGQSAQSRPATWNRRGQVVGSSFAYARLPFGTFFHPYVWDDVDGFRVIDVGEKTPCREFEPRPCGSGAANDINASSLVVGFATDTTGVARAFYWDDEGRHDLDLYPGESTTAVAVNDRGEIIGQHKLNPRDDEPAGSFLLTNGNVVDLGSLGGGGTAARSINDRGEIIGTSLTAAGERRAFLWSNGTMLDLGPTGVLGGPVAMNQRGDVLVQNRGFSGPATGVLWRRGAPSVIAASR
jgi:probable HAF family extracellular repeat protein